VVRDPCIPPSVPVNSHINDALVFILGKVG
jgi:hypothetical protein